jgi:hypothetical protein
MRMAWCKRVSQLIGAGRKRWWPTGILWCSL